MPCHDLLAFYYCAMTGYYKRWTADLLFPSIRCHSVDEKKDEIQ